MGMAYKITHLWFPYKITWINGHRPCLKVGPLSNRLLFGDWHRLSVLDVNRRLGQGWSRKTWNRTLDPESSGAHDRERVAWKPQVSSHRGFVHGPSMERLINNFVCYWEFRFSLQVNLSSRIMLIDITRGHRLYPRSGLTSVITTRSGSISLINSWQKQCIL